ncbi:hypothetical protein GCM10023346_20640 [Arthrobacter gyeryongensis]|uniref:Transposase IS116/IS110/IS902 family protein n=1 Tax=Arthrobacter gyeryongensis TaxID=1650592 RepID=A0ABP9SF54_9MICC
MTSRGDPPSSLGPNVSVGSGHRDRSTDPHRSRLPHGQQSPKRTLYLSAFAALKDPLSGAYYDRKRAVGKRHKQALIALARRRSDTLHAMLRDGSIYQPKTPTAA